MHTYFENIRLRIEEMAGDERYLTNSVFWNIAQSIPYEDLGERALKGEEECVECRDRAIATLDAMGSVDSDVEILSWQTGILRDLCRYFYYRWETMLSEEIFAGARFADASPCLVLEAACETTGYDPTEMYTLLLEAQVIANDLYHIPVSAIQNAYEFGVFSGRMSDAANSFTEKRIELERSKVILLKKSQRLMMIRDACLNVSKALCGKEFLTWATLAIQVEAFSRSLSGVFECSSDETMLWLFDKYTDCILPEKLLEGYVNPFLHSRVHRDITRAIQQGVTCLYENEMNNGDTMAARDTIVRDHVREQLMLQVNRERRTRFASTASPSTTLDDKNQPTSKSFR